MVPNALTGQLAAAFVLALALAAGVIGLLLATKAAPRIATDLPNDRSLHARPVPRVGGWGVVPAALATAMLFGAADTLLVCIIAALFFISYADDRYGLPSVVRFAVHGVAAAVWLSQGHVQLPFVIAILAGCGIVWITNLFNFMDGSDGLAGGMAIFACATFGAVAAVAGNTPLAVWTMAFAGAVGGFLFFNWNPAVVFLGDAGSISLGFVAGVFGIWGWADGVLAVLVPVSRRGAVLRGCDGDALPARVTARSVLARAPGALLSAPDQDGMDAPPNGGVRIRADGGLLRACDRDAELARVRTGRRARLGGLQFPDSRADNRPAVGRIRREPRRRVNARRSGGGRHEELRIA